MTVRHTRKAPRATAVIAITTGLVLAVAGCGGGGGDDKDDKKDEKANSASPTEDGKNSGGSSEKPAEENEVLAEVKGESNITLTINRAERDSGGFVTVEGTVHNGSGSRWTAPNWMGTENELSKNTASLAGATLVDKVGKKRYLILRDTDGRCLCTRFATGVAADETAHWYAQFPAPPSSTVEVTFQVGAMPPAEIKLTDK